MKAICIAAILAACALTGCALEDIEGEAVDEQSLALAADEATVQESGDELGAASTTWQFTGRESCGDIFEQPCSSTVPSNQCGSNPSGQPCSPSGAHCWHVISPAHADLYVCF
jgi:hypothetical protein